jgi:hypothetical protein
MTQETEQIDIESLMEQITDRFDNIAEIHVGHPPSLTQLIISVHTDEAESLEQYIDPANADEVTIDTDEAEPLSIPFDIIATFDGPGHIQGSKGTTVYVSENVVGAESRELETGLSMLRQKLAGVCPICEEEVELQSHYAGTSECIEAEQV